MTQAERDRLVALKKAKKKLITQKAAAEELGITERHVRRLLRELKRRGDKVVAHGLRGLPSNRKISADTEKEAVAILSQPVYLGFGPTLASEYLANKHGIEVSRETVRQWMTRAKLWRPGKQRVDKIHEWRPRRSRFGELVQWDTSDHDWLEGRGEGMLLINMIDDATGRWFARFVASDSTVENMNLLERYVKQQGRPLGLLHRQGVPVSNRGENETGWEPRGQAAGGVAADADRPGVARVGDHLDPGAQSASERESGARISNRSGSAGEGDAGGRSEDHGASQPLSGNRVSALGEQHPGGGACQRGRCP